MSIDGLSRKVAGAAIVLFALSLVSVGQTGNGRPLAHRSGAALRRRTSPAPVPSALSTEPEIVEPLPVPIAPLTQSDLPPEPPHVAYQDGVLTVDAQNSTLSDIFRAIHRLTGAEFEPMPEVTERAAVHLSGSAGQVVSDLLRGSEFGYVIMSDPDDSSILRKVFLTLPEASSQSVLAKDAHPAAAPAPPTPDSIAVNVSEPVAAAVEQAAAADSATAAPKEPGSTALAASAAASETPAATQPAIVMPDPVQVAERVNQINQQNRDSNTAPVSAAGQYMQELYRLRMQQQNNVASSTSPSGATQQ